MSRHVTSIVETLGTTTSYTYDTAERYVYDGEDIAFRFVDADGDGAGAAAFDRRMLHGPGIDNALAYETSAGVLRWALADNQGTIRDNNSNTGTVTNHIKYDAYGNITSTSSGAGAEQPALSYTGREWDADAGLYYYRARWYDPKVGRFISEDPISFNAGDTNINRYVGNAPTNYIAPSGSTSVSIFWFGGVPLMRQGSSIFYAPLGSYEVNATLGNLTANAYYFSQRRGDVDISGAGQPGFWTGMIPIYGSTASSMAYYEEGRYGWGTVYLGLALADILLIRTAVQAGWKALAGKPAPISPLGRGSTANLTKGTTLPRNLREQLAIEEVLAQPSAGQRLTFAMKDTRWPGSDGWVKMQ